jgi:hypothetical protein
VGRVLCPSKVWLPKTPLRRTTWPDIVFRAGTLSLLPTPRFDKTYPEVVRIRVRPEREITETDPGLDLPIETVRCPSRPR